MLRKPFRNKYFGTRLGCFSRLLTRRGLELSLFKAPRCWPRKLLLAFRVITNNSLASHCPLNWRSQHRAGEVRTHKTTWKRPIFLGIVTHTNCTQTKLFLALFILLQLLIQEPAVRSGTQPAGTVTAGPVPATAPAPGCNAPNHTKK